MAHSQLTKDALARKKANGERTGSIPFGYNLEADGVSLTKDEFQFSVIERMKLRRSQGASYHTIAKELTADKILTAKGKETWTHQSVSRVVSRGQCSRWTHTAVKSILGRSK
jgi:DNA invertase Pin-like site-specific DNA recombinase